MGITEKKGFWGTKYQCICDKCGTECTSIAGYTSESIPKFYWQARSGVIGLCNSCEKVGIENLRLEDMKPSDCWCSQCKQKLTKENVKFFCANCKKSHPDSTHSFHVYGGSDEYSYCSYCSTLRKRNEHETSYWYPQSNNPSSLAFTCAEVEKKYRISRCISGQHQFKFIADYTKNESKVSKLPRKSPFPAELQIAFGLTQYDELFQHCGYTLFRCITCGELCRELPQWAETKLRNNRI
jgi:hypothetical protein